MSHDLSHVVDLLLDSDDTSAAEHALLMENEEDRLTRKLGNQTLTDYLLKFEEYLDDHDLYLYDGWEDAQVLGRPKVKRFWVVVYLWADKNVDLRGIYRIKTDQEGQNQVKIKSLKNGSHIIEVSVLRRLLDKVEDKSKEEADQVSDEEIGQNAHV